MLACTAVAAVVLYVLAWIGWATPWGWVTDVDTWALQAAHRASVEHGAWVTFWNVVCTVFSPLVFRVVVAGVIVWTLMRRQWWLALFLLSTVELSGPLTELAKFLADRPRPATALVSASSTSFPSGHALGTMTSVAAVLAVLAVAVPTVWRAWRWWLIVAGTVIVLAVGVGRVALNVHHPSDVIAGWALGYAFFVAWLPLLTRVRAAGGTPAAPGSAP